jgi:hypothetical protein
VAALAGTKVADAGFEQGGAESGQSARPIRNLARSSPLGLSFLRRIKAGILAMVQAIRR